MARNTVIVGNWKMNKTPAEAKKFMTEFKKLYTANQSKIARSMKFGIAAPSVDLQTLKENKVKTSMIVAAEDMHQNASGAFTGDLSAAMIKAVGANAVVIGHSERRQYHGETDAIVNAKAKTALENKLLPIVCIGETLAERKSNKWRSVITKQVKGALKGISAEQAAKIVIAYEPIWAIGTGVTASAEQAQEACKHVRARVAAEVSKAVADKIIIQYGGSVKPENVAELMGKADIDGALVGGASLDAKSYIKLLTLNK